jgi:hypothetical protein
LLRRGLTDDEDVLTETIRTGQSGTTADKQRDTRDPNEKREFRIHDRTGSSKELRRKKQGRRTLGLSYPIITVGQPRTMTQPCAVGSPMRAAIRLPIKTVVEPMAMVSGGPTQVHKSVTRAAG